MKKTLLMHLGAMAGTAAMVAGLLTATAPEAESRSGVGNDRTGNTVNNQGMMVSSSQIIPPNDDIQPMTSNTAPTSNSHKAIKHGM